MIRKKSIVLCLTVIATISCRECTTRMSDDKALVDNKVVFFLRYDFAFLARDGQPSRLGYFAPIVIVWNDGQALLGSNGSKFYEDIENLQYVMGKVNLTQINKLLNEIIQFVGIKLIDKKKIEVELFDFPPDSGHFHLYGFYESITITICTSENSSNCSGTVAFVTPSSVKKVIDIHAFHEFWKTIKEKSCSLRFEGTVTPARVDVEGRVVRIKSFDQNLQLRISRNFILP